MTNDELLADERACIEAMAMHIKAAEHEARVAQHALDKSRARLNRILALIAYSKGPRG
jgi:hypothetical protein